MIHYRELNVYVAPIIVDQHTRHILMLFFSKRIWLPVIRDLRNSNHIYDGI